MRIHGLKTWLFVGFSLLVGPGCSTILGPRDIQVEFRTDREVYRSGEDIQLAIRNLGSDTLVYDGVRCAFLERFEAGEWEQVGTIELCIFIAYPTVRIAPGETQTVTFQADGRFEPGERHRFLVLIEPRGRRPDRKLSYSNSFEVSD